MSQTSFLPEPPPEPEVPPAESDEFFTPWEIFNPLDEEFDFTLDAAATEESAKLPRYFTKEQDGLAHSWADERVWLNCPYSDIAPWVRKAEFETFRGCRLVVMLLPATKTEQPWWQEHIEPFRDGKRPADLIGRCPRIETRFIAKRIRFGFPGSPDGGSGSGRFGSVLVIWSRP